MKLLIVVDMQKDFIDGSLGTKEAVEIVPNVKRKIAEYLERGDQVIFTQDTHEENYLSTHEGKYLPVPHCIINTEGWNIPEDIDVPSCEHLQKETFGYLKWHFKREEEESGTVFHLRKEPDEIELVGLCTDICVISNALILRANYPDCDISVDASCCAGVTPQTHQAALDVMRCCHINITGER